MVTDYTATIPELLTSKGAKEEMTIFKKLK
jgi:hypothetical protein